MNGCGEFVEWFWKWKNKVVAQTLVPVSHFLAQTLHTRDTTIVVVVTDINIIFFYNQYRQVY
jgi:hypothetical protein